MLTLFKSKKKADQIKILLVDDEPDLVSTVQYRLKCCNYEVVVAGNGKEGLEKAQQEKPNIILLDTNTNMPVMNGHEMLGHLKKHPDLKNIPVIMCTAQCEPQDIATASAYGVVDYVTKPFDYTDLREKITHILEKNRA